jgi:hypothetical protein
MDVPETKMKSACSAAFTVSSKNERKRECCATCYEKSALSLDALAKF